MNTVSDNKSLVQDFHRRINSGDLEGGCALAAEDLVNHAAIPEAQGRAGLLRVFQKLKAAMPDMVFTADSLIAEGDQVVARGRLTGTNTGELDMVRVQHDATGKPIDVQAVHVYRIAGGKIVEHWSALDHLAMQRQLGLTLNRA